MALTLEVCPNLVTDWPVGQRSGPCDDCQEPRNLHPRTETASMVPLGRTLQGSARTGTPVRNTRAASDRIADPLRTLANPPQGVGCCGSDEMPTNGWACAAGLIAIIPLGAFAAFLAAALNDELHPTAQEVQVGLCSSSATGFVSGIAFALPEILRWEKTPTFLLQCCLGLSVAAIGGVCVAIGSGSPTELYFQVGMGLLIGVGNALLLGGSTLVKKVYFDRVQAERAEAHAEAHAEDDQVEGGNNGRTPAPNLLPPLPMLISPQHNTGQPARSHQTQDPQSANGADRQGVQDAANQPIGSAVLVNTSVDSATPLINSS